VLALIGALVLAGLGTIVLVVFVNNAEDRALEGEEVVNVLVVKDTIPAGTPVGEIGGSVDVEKVPAKVVNDGAVGDLSELSGLVASIELLPGDQLTSQRFITPEQFSPSRSQIKVPTGLLEMTVTLAPDRTIGGTLRPGDTVAFIASFTKAATPGAPNGGTALPPGTEKTHLILHKVLVTNVQGAPLVTATPAEDGSTTNARPAAPQGTLLVTLAVDAAASERVAYTAEYGTIYLAREPTDAPEGGTRIQTIDTVFG
jgi:pilus assembly protein CpaB